MNEILDGVATRLEDTEEKFSGFTASRLYNGEHNLLQSTASYDAVLLDYVDYLAALNEIVEDIPKICEEIGQQGSVLDPELSSNKVLVQISDVVRATVQAIVLLETLIDEADTQHITEQISTALKHSEKYAEFPESSLITLMEQCRQLSLLLDRMTAEDKVATPDRTKLMASIEYTLTNAPFYLPVELFIPLDTSFALDQIVTEITDDIHRIYQEYPVHNVNEIVKEFEGSDVLSGNWGWGQEKEIMQILLKIKNKCNQYMQVYEDAKALNNYSGYESIDLTDKAVIAARKEITKTLITDPFFINANLFAEPKATMPSDKVLKEMAIRLSAWLNLVTTNEANGIGYNADFVSDILNSINKTPDNVSLQNYKVFRMCYDVANNGLEITDSALIAWLEEKAKDSPMMVQVKNEVLSGKTKLLTKQCVIKDWLAEHSMVDLNVLAITNNVKGKSSGTKYTTKFLGETLTLAVKSIAAMLYAYPYAFKVEKPIKVINIDPSSLHTYSKVFTFTNNTKYMNTEEARVEKDIDNLTLYLCGRIVGVELPIWQNAQNTPEIPDLPITTTRTEEISKYTDQIQTVVNKFFKAKEVFEIASKDTVQVNMLRNKRNTIVENYEGSVHSLDERIAKTSEKRDSTVTRLNQLTSAIKTNRDIIFSERALMQLLTSFNNVLKGLGEKHKGSDFQALKTDKVYLEFVYEKLIRNYPKRFEFLLADELQYRDVIEKLTKVKQEVERELSYVSKAVEESTVDHENLKNEVSRLQSALDNDMALKRETQEEAKNMEDLDNAVSTAELALSSAVLTYENVSSALVGLTKETIAPKLMQWGITFAPEFAALLK